MDEEEQEQKQAAALTRLVTAQKILESIKAIVAALVGIAALVGGGIVGVHNFLLRTFAPAPAVQVEAKFWDSPPKEEVVTVLRNIAFDLNANRAFVFFYGSDGSRTVEIFQQSYQWQKPGLSPIREASYPLAPGASTDRFRNLSRGKCVILHVSKLPPTDQLRKALLRSESTSQYVCPITLQHNLGFGGIAVEIGDGRSLEDRTQLVLLREAATLAQLFNGKFIRG